MTTLQTPESMPQWSSRFAFLMAAIGSAVGLGNLWRFPFQTGQNGGAAFVIVYLICVVLIAYPVLLAELSIGRHKGLSAVRSASNLAVASGHSKRWGIVGWVGFLAATVVLPVYCMIAGQIMAYALMSFLGEFSSGVPEAPSLYSGNAYSIFWFTLFLGLTVGVVLRGLKGGIETAASILMPVFFVMLVGLAGFAMTTGAAGEAIGYLFSPRFGELTPDVVLAAMGQALFSLGVGAAIMITYGSFLPREENIGSSGIVIASADTLVALVAGLMIFPIVFAFSLDPAAGMGLIFDALPAVFAEMPMGRFVGGLFFFLAFIAALTSSISLLMISRTIGHDQFGLTPRASTLVFGAIAWIAGIATVYVDGLGDWMDFTVGSILLPVGALTAALLAGWVAPRAVMRAELANTAEPVFRFWRFMIRYAAPLTIIIILILGVDAKFGWGLNKILASISG
ncbi:MAG: sodium-dependent transporter [Pseudomonadota bacterium]